MKNKKLNLRKKENKTGYLFILPWFLGFVLFFLYPLFYSVVLAFSTVTDLKSFQLSFAGLNNFKQALTNDMEFFPALSKSLMDLVNIPIVIVFSLIIAILLNKKFRGRGIFRVIFILPLLLSNGVIMDTIRGNHAEVSVMLGMAVDKAEVIVNSFQDLRLDNQLQTFLGAQLSGNVADIVNRISSVMWISSIQIIIFLGALQNIPKSMYEAADMDGASEFEKLWKITIPMVMPAMELNIIFTIISSFTSASNSVMTYISNVSFKNLMLSYGSAMAWMYFALIGILLLFVFAIMRRTTLKYD